MAEGSGVTEEAIHEAAFQIYWSFIREPDEQRARFRWSRLQPHIRKQWLSEAKAAFRIFDIYERSHAA